MKKRRRRRIKERRRNTGMYFGAGVEGKPAGSQSNKVVRGCFAGCKFGPRGLSVFPLSTLSPTPSSSIARCASRPLTLLESVHTSFRDTRKSLHRHIPSNGGISFHFLSFFSISDPGESIFLPFPSNRWTNIGVRKGFNPLVSRVFVTYDEDSDGVPAL